MIIFDLSCALDHPFEGWFQSLDNFNDQLEAGLIACPHCGSAEIRRVPSAIHVAKPVNTPVTTSARKPIDSKSGMLSAYHQLVSMIVSTTEDVGKDFVQEARKIHYLEAPLRSIMGEASAEDYESLCDEGIDVLRLPVLKKEKLN